MKSVAKYLFLMLCSLEYSVYGQDEFKVISGVLSENLTPEKTVLIAGDVFISPGSTVTIEAGTVLLFESFTGFHIQGTLFVKGTAANPVIFTSKNDRQYNPGAAVDPAPFDWNGIDIYDGAIGSSFQECSIKYSVYGIRSQTEHFKIVNSLFSSNGKADVTVNGTRQEITANEPYSFGIPVPMALPSPQDLNTQESVGIEKQNAVSLGTDAKESLESRHRGAPAIQVLRYTGLLIGVGCGTAAGWYYLNRFKPAQKKFEDLSDLDEYEMLVYSSKDWAAADMERKRALGLCIGGAGGAVACLGFFAISFAF